MVNLSLSGDLKDEIRGYLIRTEESRIDSEEFTLFLDDLSEAKRSDITETLFATLLVDSPFFNIMRMIT